MRRRLISSLLGVALLMGFGMSAASADPKSGPQSPRNVTLPKMRGATHVWDTLRASPGEWTGADKLSYRWQRCSAFSRAVASESAIAWWRMTEREGRLRDSSGYQNHGAYPTGIRFHVAGPLRQADSRDPDAAVGFRGTGRAVVPPSDSLVFMDEITLEAWVKPDTIPAPVPVVARIAEGGTLGQAVPALDFGLILESGRAVSFRLRLQEAVFDDEGTEFPPGAIRDVTLRARVPLLRDVWTHVVATYASQIDSGPDDDIGEMRIYVNGSLVASRPAGGKMVSEGRPITLGAIAPGRPSYAGGLDEVVIYYVPLSSDRVSAHYRAAGKGCHVIKEATRSRYRLQEADFNGRIRVQLTASNRTGRTTVHSGWTPHILHER